MTLLERDPAAPAAPQAAWTIVASAGGPPVTRPDDGDSDVLVDVALALGVRGRTLPASDRRILEAFAAQAAVALRHRRLAEAAEQVAPLEAPTGCAPRCSAPSATTCAPRWRPRWPPWRACAAPTWCGASPTGTS
ncbi:hypothetical protein [Actinomadura sp. CNU-125]|uniref:hypothetical protein n=1 Tax=Actinomadura sp. CNU-125 TaxID=1904961 RepID=UPI003967A882